MEKWLTPALLTRFMFNPYENIVIGNFLYGLGLAMGRHPQGVSGCVNLLQQGPLDPVLGDVMLQFPAVWRLIEFKRDGADLSKEKVKLEMFLGAIKDNEPLRAVSKAVHWFVVSGDRQEKGEADPAALQIKVRPYLDMASHEAGGTTLEDFAEEIVRQACDGEWTSSDQLDVYMEFITLFGQLRGLNTSGLLVGVSGKGGLTYVPVPDVSDLRGTAQMLRARMYELSRQAEVDPLTYSAAVRDHLSMQRHVEVTQVQKRSHERVR